jgi:hypothetical protein
MEINNGWKEYSKMVLNELERLGKQQEQIQKDVHKISLNIVELKVKASMWGMMAGLIPGIIAYILKK